MSKNINIDSRKVSRWMHTQVATSQTIKTRLKRTSTIIGELATKSNADSLNTIAKDVLELVEAYEPIHKNYVEVNTQMLKTNKLAQSANNVR